MTTCPTGKKVLGGGAYPNFGDSGVSGVVDRVAIHASTPLSVNSENDSWDVQAVETAPDDFTTWSLIVWAVCATV